MPEIKQTLGFNATQALNTLARLDSIMRSFKSAVSSTTKVLGSFNAKADVTDGVLKRLKASAGGAATQLNRMNKAQGTAGLTAINTSGNQAIQTMDRLGNTAATAADKAAKGAKKATDQTQKWTVSWQTLGRVVATQAIVRALNAIRQALRAAVGDAVKFQKAVAEIGTISGEKLGDLEAIEDMVIRVSTAFNIGLDDTAEATYQTISNQIGETEKQIESFLGSAARFAKTTKTDMATSVNLLSGTLNAFGKEVSETDQVAAQFFKTIELGRTRAEELAQGLGTISPVADHLGISIQELNAAVATLTIGGIKTDKAITQIRGTMQGFLKPTTAMKEAMAELGFETGEQVLQAYNLQEAVRAVVETTDGNAAAIAKLFPRIRGLTGVMGLASDESEHFTKTMKEQRTALEETYGKAYHLVLSTDAEKVTKALNKIRIAFVDLFGQQFLAGAARLFGTLENLATNEAEFIARAFDERQKTQEAALRAEEQLLKSSLDERAKLMAQHAAVARKEFLAAASAAEEANEIISASTNWAIDSMMGPVDAAVDAITKASSEINKTLAEGVQLTASTTQKVQDILFQRGIKAAADDPVLQISLLRKRAAEENMRAQELARQADFKGAEAAQNNFVALNQQAHGIAVSAKNTKAAAELSRFLAIRTDRLREATEEGRKATKDGAKGLAEAGRDIVAYKAEVDSLIKKMQEAQKAAADKDLTPSEQAIKGEEAVQAVDAFTKKYAEMIEKFAQSADPLVRKLFQDIEAQDIQVEIDTIMTLPGNMQEIFGQIRDAADAFFKKIPIEVQLFAEERGLATDTPKQVDEAMTQYNQTLQDQAGIATNAKVAQKELANEMKKIEVLMESISDVSTPEALADFFGALTRGPGPAIKETLDKGQQFTDFKTVMDEIKTGLKEGFSTEQIGVINKQLENLADRGFSSKEALRQLNDAIVELPTLQEAGRGLGVGQQELQISNMLKSGRLTKEQLQTALQEVQARKQTGAVIDANKTKVDTSKASQEQLNQSVKDGAQAASAAPVAVQETDVAAQQLQQTELGVGSAVSAAVIQQQQHTSEINNSITAAQQLVSTLSQASSMSGMVNNPFAEFNAKGGRMNYFANGGRGTDQIPAMLSDGEHVTNAKASRRWASQLVAMNAGREPVFRESGGSTTNIGDVSINVNESASPKATAREVMSAIRRETRRGSSK